MSLVLCLANVDMDSMACFQLVNVWTLFLTHLDNPEINNNNSF